MSFWQLHAFETVHQIASGTAPNIASATDPELASAYRHLTELLLRRAEALDANDWEWLVVDYFKAQGAHVDERQVGGSRSIIDAEAHFDHGDLGEEVWRIQVKRYQDQTVDWPEIEHDLMRVGAAQFCFVSVYGFTDMARKNAQEQGVRVLEAADFVPFLLGGKIRARLREKLKLPAIGGIPLDTTDEKE
jgi:restriction endonuclease Mrr